MALTAAQRSDIIEYAKRRRMNLSLEYVQEKWMGCTNESLKKKIAFIGVLMYVLESDEISTYLTDDEIALVFDRLKCVIQYDYNNAGSTSTGKKPWLTYNSIDWDAYDGVYWELP